MVGDSYTADSTDDAVLTVPDHVLVRRVDDEIVLLDLHTERYFAVDGPAAVFLDRLESLQTVARAASELTKEFEAEEAVLLADLTELTTTLIDAGLLHAAA